MRPSYHGMVQRQSKSRWSGDLYTCLPSIRYEEELDECEYTEEERQNHRGNWTKWREERANVEANGGRRRRRIWRVQIR